MTPQGQGPDVAARQVLFDHAWNDFTGRCRCGWYVPKGLWGDDIDWSHVDHQLAALPEASAPAEPEQGECDDRCATGPGWFWTRSEWAEWSNRLAVLLPEGYDGDEAQESLIERAVADLAARASGEADLRERLRKAAVVAHKGPHDTDAKTMRTAARDLREGYHVGGGNRRAAMARVLDVVADALADTGGEGQ